MVIEARVKSILTRLAEAFAKLAAVQGWKPGDYRVFVRWNEEWGWVRIILVAKYYHRSDSEDPWFLVRHFLKSELKDEPALMGAINFVAWTFDQVAKDGLDFMRPGYVELEIFERNGVTP